MSISPQNYVNIVSGVGASANVPTRDLIGRFFTGNLLVPPHTFVEFTSAAQVISFFGISSEEAQRAIFYFSFISKTLVQPAAIQFARWNSTDVAPMIQSISGNNSVLANWSAIDNGSFGLTIAPIVNGVVGTPVIGTFQNVSFAGAQDMTDVAEILTEAVQSDFITNLDGSLTSGSTAVSGLSSTADLVAGMHVFGVGIPSGTNIASINVNSFTLPGTTVSGNATITMADTDGVVVGQGITGAGVPALSTVLSIIEDTSITISANATASASVTLTFQPSATTSTKIVLSQAAEGANQTGVLTSTDTTVTGLQDTSILVVGMEVSGTGIAANTQIASITNSTTIELSIAATASGSQTLSFIAETTPLEFFTPTNTVFAGSSVVFSAGQFIFTGGSVGDYAIELQAGTSGTDLTPSPLLGWLPRATFINGVYSAGAIVSNGSAAQTITQCLDDSVSRSNNFGSFLFLNNLNLSLADAILAGNWNLAKNNMFMFCAPVTSSNYLAWTNDATGLGLIGGTALTLSGLSFYLTGTITSSSAIVTGLPSTSGLAIGMPVVGTGIPSGTVIIAIAASPSTNITLSNNATSSATEVLQFVFNQFPEQIPMMVEAATDYYARNSVQNYMFQGPFAGVFPSVVTDEAKNQYDAVSVNYYGNTQQAGDPVNFYQIGVLQGASPSPLDMTTYVNEIWLKDAITTEILNMFVTSNQIPANTQGRAQILAGLQSVINTALANGTISANKTLSSAQRMFITAQTNDDNAWYQVQSIGYWVDCAIINNAGVYSAKYTLIYSKDDVIRLVNGQDILI